MRESQSIKDLDNNAEKVRNKLNFEGLVTFSHSNGTNYIYLQLIDKKDLSEKIKKMNKLEEIENFIMWSDPKQEILDAISDHDYFKAFALSGTVFVFLTKRILINHFNDIKLSINEERIQSLGFETAITMLYTHKLIEQPIYSDMISVNKVRSDFIHYKLFQTIGKEDFQKIIQNIPKLERSINKLEKIYEWSEKTH